jgi:transcriptional regulator with XRE-family HTH domain
MPQTRTELGKIVGVDNAQIDGRQVSRYENENDRVIPSVEVVIKMAKAFNVKLDYLLLDNSSRRSLEPTTSQLAQRVPAPQDLSEEDEKSLLNVIDAIEAKNKLKSLAESVQWDESEGPRTNEWDQLLPRCRSVSFAQRPH